MGAGITSARRRAGVTGARRKEVQELQEKGRRRCRSDLGVTTYPLPCGKWVKGEGRRCRRQEVQRQ